MDDGKIENSTCEGPCTPMGKGLFTLSAIEMRKMENILFVKEMFISRVILILLLLSEA